MDPLKPRLLGHFRQTHPSQPAAPYLAVTAFHDQRFVDIEFLIDTGADRTMIAPRDAVTILGERQYHALNRQSGGRIPISGVGAGGEVVERELLLVFRTETGTPIVVNQNLWIALELKDQRGVVVNRLMPSLLGRDILNDFTLTVSAALNMIELIREIPTMDSDSA